MEGAVNEAIAELTTVTGQINAAYDRADREEARLRRLNAERQEIEIRLADAQRVLTDMQDKAGIDLAEAPESAPEPNGAIAMAAIIPDAETAEIETAALARRAEPLVPRQDSGAPTRALEDVAKALKRAPGISRLTPEQRDVLQARLVEGACMTDVLREVTGKINRHTLAVLMRSLDVMCGS